MVEVDANKLAQMLPPAEVGMQLWTTTAVHSQGICRAIAHFQGM
ncbi:hypothetical protein [Nostoc sp. UHCC 0252]|nr:hypothetical protein [Nostoc sp. UHCC 0252]MEA5606013.1 hypothetical protein [Nostoc sp. UHCC 0252]